MRKWSGLAMILAAVLMAWPAVAEERSKEEEKKAADITGTKFWLDKQLSE
jgi:hypothetical protein